jgi:ABC-type glycerol-3-phosphate transport system substrate-binding protein
MRRFVMAMGVMSVALTACSSSGKNAAAASDTTKLTKRQTDSVIGASRIPGAQGIQKAQRAQDTAAAQAARLDSIR